MPFVAGNSVLYVAKAIYAIYRAQRPSFMSRGFNLQTIVDGLTKKGVVVRFHKENLEFGGQDSAIQTLMFQMMGAFAQFERALIRERQREGIAAAKANGKHVGAPSKLTPEMVAEVRQKLAQGSNKKAVAANTVSAEPRFTRP